MRSVIFADKTIFLTGGSGFLGTTLVCKIILSTACSRLIVLCRGGLSRLLQIWQDTLPGQIFETLCDDHRIEVVNGDICDPNLGLDEATLVRLKETVNIVIHAASSINLRYSLARIAPVVVQGTLNVAAFALGCEALDRLVHVSTAYTNSHLHYLDPETVPCIRERIYSLVREGIPCRDVEKEWSDVQKHGTTLEFESTPFPWAYAYAKHLTERLLSKMFQETSSPGSSISSPMDDSIDLKSRQKLLIVRPSIIGPAESFPLPGWQVATSAPITGLLAFVISSSAKRLHFYSQFDDPSNEALADEVPVDIVANRIVMHTFVGTDGVVHANRDLSDCYSFGEYTRATQPLRRLPWNSKFIWHKDSKSLKLCQVAKLYQVMGCTFDFDSQKTSDLWSVMKDEDKKSFPLFTTVGYSTTGSKIDITSRDDAFQQLFAAYLKKRNWPGWALPMLYAKP